MRRSHYLASQTFGRLVFLVAEVASLAKHLERAATPLPTEHLGWSQGDFCEADDGDTIKTVTSARGAADMVIDTNNRDPLTGSLHFAEKLKLMTLLEQWEEPQAQHHANVSRDAERRSSHGSSRILKCRAKSHQ